DIAESLIETFVELHALDYEAAGLGELGRPAGYAERQIKGWTKRYFKAKTDEHAELEQAIEWLNANIPTNGGSSLVHNDFKHDNVVLDTNDFTKVIAILDWEMCTLGDPLMDLGSTLGYWMNPNDPPLMRTVFPNPSVLPGNPTRGELIKMYEEKSGRKIDNPVFYYAYGLFKLAVIVQQIYARYVKGHTQDPRFKNMNVMVMALGQMAAKAIDNNDIDNLN
ncbi:MAG: phosphotransferase family protein, partial [Saprospiraceae bacterium]